jgi:hypothetical protein
VREDSSGDIVLRFPASVTDPKAPAEVFAEIRYKKYDVDSLDIRLNILVDDRDRRIHVYSDLLQPKWSHLWLYAKPPHTDSVEILGLRGVGSEGNGSEVHSVIPTATTIQVGISDEAFPDERKLHVSVELEPSGILEGVASLTFMGDGSIERREVVKGRVNVSLTRGVLHARDWYDSVRGKEFGDDVTKLIQRAILAGDVTVPAGMSLSAFHDTLQGELADACTILSLCYRVTVQYYEINYFHAPEGGAAGKAFLRRRIPATPKRPLGRDELINFHDLRDGGLDRLFSAFASNKAKDELARAIHFLASSYGTTSLEAGYFLVFSGLECAVGAAEGKTAYALGAARWDRLEKRLQGTIAMFLRDEFADENEREELETLLASKLPDVRRISIRRRVATVSEKLGLMLDDLWPASTGFEEGFRRATSARNALFHAAACEEPEAMNGDMVRLCVLTERIVLKLLAWPDEKIWHWYDQELRWLNRE